MPQRSMIEAERDAADADLHAANVEGLLRVGRMSEAPDEAGKHDRRGEPADEFAQERDAEHAEEKLFGDGREEAAEQDEGPGESAC